jgi:photosystem II stability/assembly factor-like uncharacterized protein
MKCPSRYFVLLCAIILAASQLFGQQPWQRVGPAPNLLKVQLLDSINAVAVGWRYPYTQNVGVIQSTTDWGTTWPDVPSGSMDCVAGLSFCDQSNGLAVGYKTANYSQWPAVRRTTDGGATWEEKSTGQGNRINAIAMIDATTATAVGEGTILRTTDGGASWINQSRGTTQDIRSLCWGIDGRITGVGNKGTIVQSNDGGLTWANLSSGTEAELYGVAFGDSSVGMAVGRSPDPSDHEMILRTTNGGAMWERLSSGFKTELSAVCMSGPDTGTVVGGGIILQTTDRGGTWTEQSEGTVYDLSSCCIADPTTWIAFASDGGIIRTTNAGVKWERAKSPTTLQLKGVHALAPHIIVAVGRRYKEGVAGGVIFRSTDDGEHWTEVFEDLMVTFSGVSFSGPMDGMAFGNDNSTRPGSIYRTTDGGATWERRARGINAYLEALSVLDPGTAVAEGSMSTGRALFRSTDGGLTWSAQALIGSLMVTSICFTNSQNGIAVGTNTASSNSAMIVKSNDGGITWSNPNAVDAFALASAAHYGDSSFIVVGSRLEGSGTFMGYILRSTDLGGHWTFDKRSDASRLLAVSANRGGNMVTTGGDGVILTSSDAGATWSNSGGTCGWLEGIAYGDRNTGAAVGFVYTPLGEYKTQIKYTSDAGKNWLTPRSNLSTYRLTGVSFADARIGIAVGDGYFSSAGSNYGVVFRTTDGGETWSEQLRRGQFQFNGVSISAEGYGLVAGFEETSSAGIIFRTTDWGLSWGYQSRAPFKSLYCSANHGPESAMLAGSAGVIQRSTDAGSTWADCSGPVRGTLNAVSFSDVNIGTAVGSYPDAQGESHLWALHTTDGGSSWVQMMKGIAGQFHGIHFVDRSNGMIVGESNSGVGLIYHTTDGGNQWQLYLNYAMSKFNSVMLTSPTNAWIVGRDGACLQTTNRGLTWLPKAIGTTVELNDVFFRDERRAIVVGDGVAFHTSDGGEHWVNHAAGTGQSLFGVSYFDSNTGVAVGAAGTLLRTTDCGSYWASLTNSVTQTLRDVYVCSDGSGMAVGDSGTIIGTVDRGLSWTRLKSGTMRSLNSVYMQQSGFAVAVGDSGVILKSTDSGLTWKILNSGTKHPLYGLSFCGLIGTAVGGGEFVRTEAVILRSTDGGESWSTQASDTAVVLRSVYVTDDMRGFATGNSGVLLRTTDGGMHWRLVPLGTWALLTGVSFTSPSDGTVVGYSRGGHGATAAAILRTTDAGENWSLQAGGTVGGRGGAVVVPGAQLLTSCPLNDVWSVDEMNVTAVGDNGIIVRTTTGGGTWTEISPREDRETLPDRMRLEQNYPNPFNPKTVVSCQLPAAGRVKLVVYDILGREVKVLMDEKKEPGRYEVTWDARNCASGVYICRMQAGGYIQCKKMLLLR